ncbi:hypothetical protein FSP39_010352 [Pinctada imbricata]|uniref:Uncharacterized protein n=1 Tax=Pinctada imbricata TaxID=66713 RepID=A0AA89C932_PINIB|nr:hypothetical protein FSP39_010352 [Pinctada imbricata]
MDSERQEEVQDGSSGVPEGLGEGGESGTEIASKKEEFDTESTKDAESTTSSDRPELEINDFQSRHSEANMDDKEPEAEVLDEELFEEPHKGQEVKVKIARNDGTEQITLTNEQTSEGKNENDDYEDDFEESYEGKDASSRDRSNIDRNEDDNIGSVSDIEEDLEGDALDDSYIGLPPARERPITMETGHPSKYFHGDEDSVISDIFTDIGGKFKNLVHGSPVLEETKPVSTGTERYDNLRSSYTRPSPRPLAGRYLSVSTPSLDRPYQPPPIRYGYYLDDDEMKVISILRVIKRV